MGEIQTVLLVDDEDDIRTVGELSLSGVGGWRTVVASSGEEAILLAQSHKPDVILLDVMMPDLDGPATLARLRDTAATEGIPVIFLTARVRAEEIEHYGALGAIGVIPKPFDPMHLPARVREILEHG